MKSKRRIVKIIIYTILVAIVSSMVTIFALGCFPFDLQRLKTIIKVNNTHNVIKDNFLFEYDSQSIEDNMILGMISALDDKYANYFPSDEYQDKLLDLEGHTYGIGISVVSYEENSGYIKIVQIHENSPAQEVGLKSGDIIIKIDDEDIKSKNYHDSVELIKGEDNTNVKLTVLRDDTEISFEVTRKDVELTYVLTQNIDNIGYVRIIEFSESTSKQFEQKVDELISQGVKGLVFDLRNNGGGTMSSVLDMLDYLLPQGAIAKVEDKNGNEKVYRYSDDECIDLPMITITNGNTASASELFVQTLKDFDKAKSVGTKTFGKGIIQTNYTLFDGSGLKLTTGYFSGPNSENFHGVGIEADYEIEISNEDNKKLQTNELDVKDDLQLQKALEILKNNIK